MREVIPDSMRESDLAFDEDYDEHQEEKRAMAVHKFSSWEGREHSGIGERTDSSLKGKNNNKFMAACDILHGSTYAIVLATCSFILFPSPSCLLGHIRLHPPLSTSICWYLFDALALDEILFWAKFSDIMVSQPETKPW